MTASSWFDLRVFYVRISNYEVDESTPDHLTIIHRPLRSDTIIEINGRDRNSCAEILSSSLRRDRADKRTEESTFVSTDKIRMTGSVRFEIYNENDALFAGIMELVDGDDSRKNWRIGHLEMTTSGYRFLKGKKRISLGTEAPAVEVYATGCFSGSPIILAKTLRLYSSDALQEDLEADMDGWGLRGKHLDEEEGEASWFNAGVRVGVGIGLGVSIGVGVGVGLLVRAYRLTVGRWKRR